MLENHVKLVEFLSSATSKEKGFFTKSIVNGGKYKADLVQEFKQYKFDDNLSFPERYYLIVNGLTTGPKCSCGKTCAFDVTQYKNYCSQSCYVKTLSKKNPAAKEITIEGITYQNIKDAEKQTGLSRYKLKRLTIQSIEQKTRLCNVHSHLIDYEWMKEQKKNRNSAIIIADTLNVKVDYVRDAFLYHELGTKFDQISPISKEMLESYDTMYDIVIEKNMYIADIVKQLDVSFTSVEKAIKKHQLPYTPKRISHGQYTLFQWILSLGFNAKCNDQTQLFDTIDGIRTGKEIDIYIDELKLGIEYNGLYYHQEGGRINSMYHQKAWQKAKHRGIRLIQIFEDEWISKQELVKKKLMHIMGLQTDKIYARKCIVKNISNVEVRDFYIKNHLYGHKNCKEVKGLFFDDELVAAMSFTNQKLERFASSVFVIGGFSKLLKAFEKSKVETFADLCWSDSDVNVYTTNGFKLVSITRPNYYWSKKGIRYRREKFQKHLLKNMPCFDESLTESQIMTLNGYIKIFDAGHAKLIFESDK